MPSKGFTLTEILIAIVLVALIILTVTVVDITSRQFFAVTKEQTHAQDEVKIAMEHMVKNFVQAHEIYDFGSALENDPFSIGVRLDINPITRLPNNTPDTDGDDTWIVYTFVSADPDADDRPTIRYYRDAASAGLPPADPSTTAWPSWLTTDYEIIATEVFVDAVSPAMFTVTDNRIDIDITAQEEDASINLQTSVISRSMSAT